MMCWHCIDVFKFVSAHPHHQGGLCFEAAFETSSDFKAVNSMKCVCSSKSSLCVPLKNWIIKQHSRTVTWLIFIMKIFTWSHVFETEYTVSLTLPVLWYRWLTGIPGLPAAPSLPGTPEGPSWPEGRPSAVSGIMVDPEGPGGPGGPGAPGGPWEKEKGYFF